MSRETQVPDEIFRESIRDLKKNIEKSTQQLRIMFEIAKRMQLEGSIEQESLEYFQEQFQKAKELAAQRIDNNTLSKGPGAEDDVVRRINNKFEDIKASLFTLGVRLNEQETQQIKP